MGYLTQDITLILIKLIRDLYLLSFVIKLDKLNSFIK